MPPPTLAEVEQLASQLPAEEQRSLVERLKLRLTSPATANGPRSLRGIWKGKVPEDFDVEAAIREIRTQWHEDLEDLGK